MNTTNGREKGTLNDLCSNCTRTWVNKYIEPNKNLERVEGCVILLAVFMIVLVIGAPRRRQSQSIIIRYAVEGAFVLSFPFLSYTLGLMQGQVISTLLYPVWTLLLVFLFGGTNSMSSRKLNESKQFLKIFSNFLLFAYYMGASAATFTALRGTAYNIVSISTAFLLGGKFALQCFAEALTSKPTRSNGIKRLASHMKLEHQLSQSWDPRTMQGYKYHLVTGASELTVEDIFADLSCSDSPPICRLKDLCLSFALCHLVVRRYFGYTCHESKHDKTRDLVLHGLLRTEQDYERAFQVIEAELGFLYDYFFTKYASVMYFKGILSCGISLASAVFLIAVGEWAVRGLNTSISMDDHELFIKISTRDVIVTRIVVGVVSIFQLVEIWSYCVSDWAKVSLVCNYVTRSSWEGACIEKLLLLAGRPHRCLRYWRNTIGQYSVLDSSRSRYWDRLKYRLFQSRKTCKPVELSLEMKKAVAGAIKISITGHLSNGASVLMRHGMSDELCWACKINDEFTLIHSILVWHIATSYCEISEMVRQPDEVYVHPNQGVATSLSKYCAYLVAFVPTLIPPGSPTESEGTLDNLETIITLREVSPTEKYEELRNLPNILDVFSSNIIPDVAGLEIRHSVQLLTKGVQLGMVLESMENRTIRWDLLAEFWAEMLVYIAPSDNVAGHIEKLAEGGEFVTHVWALLMHAGILERPADATAVP